MRSSAGAAALVGVVALSLPVTSAHEADPSRFNYIEHVRPILAEHCGSCHRQGGVAPMSLLEFQEAVPWANSIKMQVLERGMPPWLPADGTSSFRAARGLSAEEIDVIVDWAVGQTPEGEGSSGAAEVAAPPSWSMGEPDLILDASAPIVLGEDDYEREDCAHFSSGLEADRLVDRFELRPGSPTVVRRATVFLGESCGGAARPLATWLPGQTAGSIATVLPASSPLSVAILYRKGWAEEGTRIEDRSQLGIGFAEGEAKDETLHALRVTEARHRLDRGLRLLAVYPDPDSGEEAEPLRIEAVRPDGEVVPLLVIERYQPDWREKYVFDDPVVLPSGSELRLSQPSVWFDVALSRAAADE